MSTNRNLSLSGKIGYTFVLGFLLFSGISFTSCESNKKPEENIAPEKTSLTRELEELQSEIDLLNDAIATDDLLLDSLLELGVIPADARTEFQEDYQQIPTSMNDEDVQMLTKRKEATDLMGDEFDSIQKSRDEKTEQLKGLLLAKDKIEKSIQMDPKSLEELEENLNELSE